MRRKGWGWRKAETSTWGLGGHGEDTGLWRVRQSRVTSMCRKIYPFFSPLLTQPQSSILEPYNHSYLVNSGWTDTTDCTKSLQVSGLECTDTCGRLALILWMMRSKSCLHCPSTMFAPSSTCWPPKNERKHGRSSHLYFKNSFKLYLLHTQNKSLFHFSAHLWPRDDVWICSFPLLLRISIWK